MLQKYVNNPVKDLPELIYNLKYKYDFYWDEMFHPIYKSLADYIKPEKHSHKLIAYKSEDKGLFFVLYRKADQVVYHTDYYLKDKNESRICYCKKKMSKYYRKAEDERLYDKIIAAETAGSQE